MIEEPPSDLAELRQRYPGWRIAARWVTRPTGPDARTLIATRGTTTLTATTAAALAEAIGQAEQADQAES